MKKLRSLYSILAFSPSSPNHVNMHPFFKEKASALHFLNSVADFTQLIFWFYRCSADLGCAFVKYEVLH